MLELRHWPKTLGSFTIGGAVGSLLGALVYLSLKIYFEGTNPYGVIGLCGAIGAGVQRMVQRAGGFLGFFEQLYELGKLAERGIIKKETYQEIVDELVKRRFLNK